MYENPYKYVGPLDPVKDELVCAPRKKDVTHVIDGIARGEYWMIRGPRQSGKTTFLRQIRNALSNAHYIYINFETPPSNEKSLYQFLTARFEEIPSKKIEAKTRKYDEPLLKFIDFLENFSPQEEKKIILLIDEIDDLPSPGNFLHGWRRVFQERDDKKELEKYIVIITGASDLVILTKGPNSPFNIAKSLDLTDLTDAESEKLIDGPLKKHNIKISQKAKKKLISQIAGHPQILQHACSILFEKAKASNPDTLAAITVKDVDDAVKVLLKKSPGLKTLKSDFESNTELNTLIRDVLRGKERAYEPNIEFSTMGAGAIKEQVKEEGSFCVIRNEVYKKFIKKIIKDHSKKNPRTKAIVEKFFKGIGYVFAVLGIILASIQILIKDLSVKITAAGTIVVIALFLLLLYLRRKEN